MGVTSLIALILDQDGSTDVRAAALRGLRAADPEAAVEAALTMAFRSTEPDELLRLVGAELAALRHSGCSVTEFDLRDSSAVAYDAFCEWRLPPDALSDGR